MTGDGVNDAPALERAGGGVAMGQKGTEAAKAASDVVLADNNSATIAAAVHEGRAVYDNLKKFILFMLPTNGGEALVVIAAILFELTLPLTLAQILWINLVTSSTLGLFLWELSSGTRLETARTIAVNAIVVADMFYLINSRPVLASALNREGLTGNWVALWAIAACVPLQLAFTHLPPMQGLFGSTELDAVECLKVLAAGLLVFWVAELEKFAIRSSPLAARLTASWRLPLPAGHVAMARPGPADGAGGGPPGPLKFRRRRPKQT